jgi:hypothetical protein
MDDLTPEALEVEAEPVEALEPKAKKKIPAPAPKVATSSKTDTARARVLARLAAR